MSTNIYENAYNRLHMYFSSIPHIGDFFQEKTVTIHSLNQAYNIPLSVIRNDLATITSTYKKSVNYLPFSPDNDEFEFDDIAEVISDILAGKWDTYPLICNFTIQQNIHTINLLPSEFIALDEELSHLRKLNYSGSKTVPCKIKENYSHNKTSASNSIIVSTVDDAINQGKQIYFEYKTKNNGYIITPIKIIYDNEENSYAILSVKNKQYIVYKVEEIIKSSIKNLPIDVTPLDQSLSSKYESFIHILSLSAETYDKDALAEKIPHVWKNSFDVKRPTHVKIKFHANVYKKVLADIAYRQPARTLSPINKGYFYFEDDIYGIDAFERWIRSYGCTAVVLEPQSLAEKRIESIKQTLNNYNSL